MNIISFIPARSGSKSIEDKNIKELGGKPLIAYTIETSLKCGLRTIVDTNSEKYAEIAKSWGAEVLIRDKHLSGDRVSMFDVLRNEIHKIDPKPDLILLLQPTTPFRKKVHAKLAILTMERNFEKYDSLVSVERVPEKYNAAVQIIETPMGKRMLLAKTKSKFYSWLTGKKWEEPRLSGYPISKRMTSRHDHPEAWIPTGEIYIFKSENLSKGSIYGDNIMLLESEPMLNINSKDDWEKAEEYLNNKKDA